MKSLVRPYFEALILLLLAAGFVALVGTGHLTWPVIAAALLVFTLRAYLIYSGIEVRLPAQLVTLATVFYFLFYLADVYLLSANFIQATVHLVLFVAAVKLFSASQARDYIYLCVLAFLEILAAATLTVGTSFLLSFALFLLLTVATFVSYEVLRAESAAKVVARTEHSDFPLRLRASLFGISVGIASLVLVSAGVIFFLLPRISLSYWNPSYRDSRLTGFSNQVRLGEVGELQQSDQVVMHVRVLSRDLRITPYVLSRLLWRGRALSQFDGRNWTSPFRPYIVKTMMGRIDFRQPLSVSDAGEFLHYSVTLEPVGTEVLFFAPRIDDAATRFPVLVVDATQTVTGIGRAFSGISYSATSDLSQPRDTDLSESSDYPSNIEDNYLQLPITTDPRIRQLALSIVGKEKRPLARMRLMNEYLQTHYRYSLKHLPRGQDPLADFLFGVKSGHCEYFASALAVMGRTLGIPTRVVNGFQTGQYNDISGEYVIRGREAHSWVEAYFPLSLPDDPGTTLTTRRGGHPRQIPTVETRQNADSGHIADTDAQYGVWLTFDPTASTSEDFAEPWTRAMLYVDAIESFWQEWVINYDFFHQLRLAQQMQARVHTQAEDVRHFLEVTPGQMNDRLRRLGQNARQAIAEHQVLVFLLLGSVAVVFFILSFSPEQWRIRLPHLVRGGRPQDRAVKEAAAYYKSLQRVLRRAGYARQPSQTAEEFLASLPQRGFRAAVSDFVRLYQSARFGGGRNELSQLANSLRSVRRSLRARA